MRTIEVTTTQNVVIQYEFAGVGYRIGAFLIDIIVLFSASSIFISLLAEVIPYTEYLISAPLFLFYFLVSEIVLDGQSIGKKAADLKVIKISGKQPTLGDYVIRWLFSFIDFYLTLGLMAIFMIKTTRQSQRLGDLIAGTTVIRMKPNLKLGFRDLMKIQDNVSHVPIYLQVIHLTEQQVLLMKKTLDIYKNHPNTANRNALKLLFKKVSIKIPPIQPTQSVTQIEKYIEQLIKDYIILTR